MSTLNLDGINYTIVFVDPTIGTAGDGSLPASALLTLPATLANDTCYLIRRTSSAYTVDIVEQSNSALVNCIIMGMPLATQVYYNLLPAEAKVWTDSYDYANVRCNIATASSSTTKASLYINNIINLYCINCYFFRDGNGGTATSYLNPMFLTNRSDYYSNFTFDYCKFGYYGYDFDTFAYRSSNSTIPTDTSKYPQRKCTNYLYANYLNSLTITNCIVNNVMNNATTSYPYSYNSSPFNITYVAQLRSDNNDIYYIDLSNADASASGYSTSHFLYIMGTTSSSVLNKVCFNFSNNRINPILYSTFKYNNRSVIYINLDVEMLTMLNNTITYRKMLGANPTVIASSNSISYLSSIFYFSFIQNINISGLYLDATTSEGKVPQARVLYIDEGNSLKNGVPNKGISDINIKLMDTSGDVQTLLAPNETTYAVLIDSFKYVTDTSTSGSSLSLSSSGNSGYAFICSDITIDTPLQNALYAKQMNFKGLNVRGYTRLESFCTADFDYLYNPNGANYGLYLGVNNYVRIREYEVNKNNVESLYQGNEQVYINTTYIPYGNTVWVDTCNCVMFSNIKTNTLYDINRDCVLASPNYITTGQYFIRNQNSEMTSYNVTRQGSTANASLRCINNSLNNYTDYLVLGKDCFKGIELTPTETGDKLFTIYLAYNDIEIPYNIRNFMYFEIRVPTDNGDGTVSYRVYSSKEGIFTADPDSTWINSTTLLEKAKIQVPITVNTVAYPIEVKIHFNMYTNLGAIYVDPDFKLL